MYSKEEASMIRKKFWIAFGQYMKLQTSASMDKVNWVNYKTGIKDLYFKTDVDHRAARISIEMTSKDPDMQALLYEQFEEFQPLFESTMQNDWVWHAVYFDAVGKQMAKIELTLENVNVFRESDWPAIIAFFKENLLKWDQFWEDVKESFAIFK
ncbi:MAG TPA: DUF4268 domain-containing protein [Moheibacter sp.]|nr:DUF4268 domain-containing protein [Moheibacter sp.]